MSTEVPAPWSAECDGRDPALRVGPIGGSLRYDAPVQLASREPFEDVELFGARLLSRFRSGAS